MKKTLIVTALALLALAGCRQKDEKEIVVEVPALVQAMAQEVKIHDELATCSDVIISTLGFTPTHICVRVKRDSDSVKKSVFDALVRAGCSGIKLHSLQIYVIDKNKDEYILKAEYKTIRETICEPIRGALVGCCGIDISTFESTNQCVRLKYDSMQTAKKNIEMAIAKAGYTANGVTPESIGEKAKDR